MSSINQEQLAENAKKLKEYNRQAIKVFVEGNIQALAIIISEYNSLKKSIRISDIDLNTITIPDREVKDIYVKVFSDKLVIDKIIKAIDSEEPVDDLSDDEIDNLSDLLYAKFSHYEYVRNLYKINSLVLTRRVPRNMEIFVSEARYCFAYEQYNAVYSLCRTILEIVLKYLYCIKNLKNINTTKLSIYSYIKDLCKNDNIMKEKLTNLYYGKLSDLIHGKKVVNRTEAINRFHDTLEVIQELYSKYEPALFAPKPLTFKRS
jgi:hypothetical protein